MFQKSSLALAFIIWSATFLEAHDTNRIEKTDLLIFGAGASGTMAAIQAARLGINVTVVEESSWVGGMLTSAGVSAIDGNHKLPSGLWGEFRQQLYNHYGSKEAVQTGWVSNTLFEPNVGHNILFNMVKESGASISFKTTVKEIQWTGKSWLVTLLTGKKRRTIEAQMVIDATELGDIAAKVGVSYRIGMDARSDSGESFAPEKANSIIQDLTYVLILKDYGPGVDKTIPKPSGYNADVFACACDNDTTATGMPGPKCLQMMEYGRLPNNKFMINWPRCGNDFYLNLIEESPENRISQLQEAKNHSLRFLYYLQHELGFKSLGIAEGEFPTTDGLPMIPYHRESRRIKGIVQLNVHDIESPFTQRHPLYRTGIAVGDYPIDHHHDKNPDAPKIDFINIKVPSYNVPLGSLIPEKVEGIIVAEKSISVSNIVNGATRLQPVVMGLGQAAGVLAYVSVKRNIQPRQVNIREVQEILLEQNAWIMPFIDVPSAHYAFKAIQRVGATGILKGAGIPFKWANQTWFYPNAGISEYDLLLGLAPYYPNLKIDGSGEMVSVGFMKQLLTEAKPGFTQDKLEVILNPMRKTTSIQDNDLLNRAEVAVLIDTILDPFHKPIDFFGDIVNQSTKP